MKLRPYQQDAYDNTLAKLEKTKSALCVMATGLGKTVFAAHVVKHFLKSGRVMFLAHREELIFQARKRMKDVTGLAADIEMGDFWAQRHGLFSAEIVISTIQTQIAGAEDGRMTRFDPNAFSLVIIDEAHRSPAASYRRVVDYYQQNPNLKLLGLTATPDRLDKKALGQIFDAVAYDYSIRDGIDDGWLVPIEQQSVFVSSLDYSQVKATAKELNGKDLNRVLEFEENLHAIADPTVQLTGDKRTLIFAASVAQAERLAEILNRHKPGSADYVCGATPKETRRNMFRDYSAGKFQYLVNVGVLTEGYDEPGVEIVVLARPTKSRLLYAQMIGRGTRPLPKIIDHISDPVGRRQAILNSKKPTLTVMDFVGNSGNHKLITTADILGGNYDQDIIDLAAKNAAKKSAREGKPADIATELEAAEREMAKRMRDRDFAAEREKILLRTKFSTAKVNPFDVLDITPIKEVPDWELKKQPTPNQLAFLKKNGIDTDGMCYTHMKQVIDTIFRRKDEGKPSPRQVVQLRKRGIDATKINRAEASKMMGELANHNWVTPRRWKDLPCYIGGK